MDIDDSGQGDELATLAPLACTSCKKQKRKCDKQLPACGLCLRIGRECQYAVPEQSQDHRMMSPEEFAQLRQRVNDLESQLSSRASSSPSTSASNNSTRTLSTAASSNSPMSFMGRMNPVNVYSDFPSIFFMDSWAYAYSSYTIQMPYVSAPSGALETLGSSHELRALIEEYFATAHRHMPCISKIRLYQHLANPLHEPGAEFLLLFMAMKLVIMDGSGDKFAAQEQLYRDAKALYTHIESRNSYTVQLMQALMLIALFELGNSIWPAAYMTTGNVVRLGYALGIHSKDAVPMLSRPTTWTEQEERRRMAWAMFVLDRYANVGQHHRPPACEDPGPDTILPSDDRDWDRGVMSATAPLSLSVIHRTTVVSSFARLCQATHMLSKVMRHCNDTTMTPEYLTNEALQLDATVRALQGALEEELSSTSDRDQVIDLQPALGICLSAAMTLYDKYSCSTVMLDGPVSELQVRVHKISIDGVAHVVASTSVLARSIDGQMAATGTSKISPFLIDCLYAACSTYAWYVRESSDTTSIQRLAEVKSTLRSINSAWRAAGEGIRIVESNEFLSLYYDGKQRA